MRSILRPAATRSALALLAGLAWSSLPAAPAAPAGCTSAEHRQFDFWVGDWEVRKLDGTVVAHNRIEKEHGGCVVHENYTNTSGYSGESLNAYDASRKVWHQSWVDNGGLLLLLEGGLRDGNMVLEGKTTGADGKETRHRITWTPNADGSVRQFWQSTDAKGEWTTAFDGRYVRKE